MLNRILDTYTRLLGVLIVVALALMVALVFGNVVLRYVFNSGITLSEELSRWLFIWMTFLGALIGMREKAHLGTDFLVARLGPLGKRVCLGVAYALMLFVCYLIFKGAWAQTIINLGTTSPVMEVSQAWVYGVGVVFALSAALFVLLEIWQLVTGRLSESDLVAIKETEEAPHDGHDRAAKH